MHIKIQAVEREREWRGRGGGNVGGRWVDIVKFVAVNYADHHMLVHTLYLRIRIV